MSSMVGVTAVLLVALKVDVIIIIVIVFVLIAAPVDRWDMSSCSGTFDINLLRALKKTHKNEHSSSD